MTPDRPIRTQAPAGLTLRRMRDDDLPFLADLYASTRREEVARAPWSAEEKERFLAWQFEAQHKHYQQHYPDCEFLVVERVAAGAGRAGEPGGAYREPIGRLYVDRWPAEIRLVDIALLPAHRGGGHGTALLERVMAEAADSGLLLSIHVEGENPALRLYRRLGFEHVDTNGVYHLMRWTPPGA